jgi:hypothetical protein
VFAVTARDRAPLGNPAPVLVLGNLGTSDYEALPSGHAIADTPQHRIRSAPMPAMSRCGWWGDRSREPGQVLSLRMYFSIAAVLIGLDIAGQCGPPVHPPAIDSRRFSDRANSLLTNHAPTTVSAGAQNHQATRDSCGLGAAFSSACANLRRRVAVVPASSALSNARLPPKPAASA